MNRRSPAKADQDGLVLSTLTFVSHSPRTENMFFRRARALHVATSARDVAELSCETQCSSEFSRQLQMQ